MILNDFRYENENPLKRQKLASPMDNVSGLNNYQNPINNFQVNPFYLYNCYLQHQQQSMFQIQNLLNQISTSFQICKDCGQSFNSILHFCTNTNPSDSSPSSPLQPKSELDSLQSRTELESLQPKRELESVNFKELYSTMIIVDTNILIQNLDETFLLKHQPHIQLVIPFICVQELDGLKKNSEVQKQAQTSLSSIWQEINAANQNSIQNVNLSESTKGIEYKNGIGPWIRPQQQDEYSSKISVKNNDDKILSLCVYLKEKYENKSRIILLSNDIGLKLKCKFYNIDAFSLQEFQSECPNFEQLKTVTKPFNEIYKTPKQDFEIPNQIIYKIFENLLPKDLLMCMGVCKQWNDILKSEYSNSVIWKSAIKSFFKKDIEIPNHLFYYNWFANWRKSIMPAQTTFLINKKKNSCKLPVLYFYE